MATHRDERLQDLQMQLNANRERAVQTITKKNRDQLEVEKAREALQAATDCDRPRLQSRIEELEPELEYLALCVEEMKTSIQAEQVRVRMQTLDILGEPYPVEHRDRAVQLMVEREKALFALTERGPPAAIQALSKRMTEIMAKIADARQSGNDSLADELVPQLDHVLEELDKEREHWRPVQEEQMRELQRPFNEELQRLESGSDQS